MLLGAKYLPDREFETYGAGGNLAIVRSTAIVAI
jgi:hypothetical protein